MIKLQRLLNDLTAIERQLDRLAKEPALYQESTQGTWLPVVDIYETPESFVLTAEVPGVASADIDIKVIDRTLILRGERRWGREAEGEHFHRLESASGKFERKFTLSARIDFERISAGLERGVLQVVLPKRVAQAGRQINIETK
jgi:HSP20 family protein